MSKTTFKFKNIDELLKLWDELMPKVQNRIIMNAFMSAGRDLLKEVKSKFDGISKKGFSKDDYKTMKKSFKVKVKKRKDGVLVGSDYYKSLWMDKGTVDRYTRKTKKYRGKIEATNFYTDAIESNKDKVMEDIDEKIIKSFERTVDRYNKKMK